MRAQPSLYFVLRAVQRETGGRAPHLGLPLPERIVQCAWRAGFPRPCRLVSLSVLSSPSSHVPRPTTTTTLLSLALLSSSHHHHHPPLFSLSLSSPRPPKKRHRATRREGEDARHGDRPPACAHTGFGAAAGVVAAAAAAAWPGAPAREMSSRSGSVGGGSVGGGSSAGGGAAVPLAVLLRREVASERTASERPELHSGLFSQAKKGEDFTFLKPDCERLPGVPSSSFSAFGVSALPTPVFPLAPPPVAIASPAAPIWPHVDRCPGWASGRGGECAIGLGAPNVTSF